METEIAKQNDYDKIVELPNFCRKLIAENEKSLKEIELITDQRGFVYRSFFHKLQRS